MAGTWLSVVEGFAGMRVRDGKLHFNPKLPQGWSELNFRIRFRDSLLSLKFTDNNSQIKLVEGTPANVVINGDDILASA